MSNPSILVVEDDPDIAELLRFNLDEEGYKIELVARGKDALDHLRSRVPDLVILDLMLPDLSGLDICKRIRSSKDNSQTPVLMLTAKGEEIDRVVGFEVGADDYVTKPFSVRELLLRVRALLRRSDPQPPTRQQLKAGELELDTVGQRARVGGEELKLTTTEFKLLQYFMENPARLLSRDHLLERVWDYSEDTESRTVDTHVRRLRKKLGKMGDVIETVHGAGYRYNLTKYGKP